jgi:hypothetical protein
VPVARNSVSTLRRMGFSFAPDTTTSPSTKSQSVTSDDFLDTVWLVTSATQIRKSEIKVGKLLDEHRPNWNATRWPSSGWRMRRVENRILPAGSPAGGVAGGLF